MVPAADAFYENPSHGAELGAVARPLAYAFDSRSMRPLSAAAQGRMDDERQPVPCHDKLLSESTQHKAKQLHTYFRVHSFSRHAKAPDTATSSQAHRLTVPNNVPWMLNALVLKAVNVILFDGYLLQLGNG